MPVIVDENAIKQILSSEEFRHLGEPRIRLIAQAYEQLFAGNDVRFYGWANPALRKELWRLLGDQIEEVSETRLWMVVRRYRDLKRKAIVDAEEEAKRKAEEEAARKKAEAKKKAAEAKAAAEAQKAEEKPAEEKPPA